MTLTTLAELKDGEYTLNVAGNSTKFIKDFAGYMVATQDVKFDAVKDTSAPQAEITKVETQADPAKTFVTIKFNKAMEQNGTTVGTSYVKNLVSRLGYNSSSAASSNLIMTDKTNEYKVTFDSVLAPGTHTLYLVDNDSTASTKAKDTWGIVFEDATLEFPVELDNVKPEVESITTEENNQFNVTFSEKVTGAKFVIKDEAGKTVTGWSQKPDAKNDKKIIITLKTDESFKGGIYTIEVKDAKDVSIFGNKMDAVTISVDTTDKIAPKVKSAGIVNGEIRVVFSEAMADSITTKANWSLIGNKIKSIELSDDGKSVVITLDKSVTEASDLQLINAKDLADNSLSQNEADIAVTNGLVTTIKVKADTGKFAPTTIALTGSNEIKVTYEDNIVDFGSKLDNTFTVKMGTETYTEFETISVDVVNGTDTEVTLRIKGGDATKDTTVITGIELTAVSDTAKNQYDQTLDGTTYTTASVNKDGDSVIADYAAPKMLSAEAFKDTKTVTVKFSENLYAGSVNESDFEISGYVVESVKVNTDGTVTLTLDESLVLDEKISVKMVGEVEDEDRNKTTETLELDKDVVVKGKETPVE